MHEGMHLMQSGVGRVVFRVRAEWKTMGNKMTCALFHPMEGGCCLESGVYLNRLNALRRLAPLGPVHLNSPWTGTISEAYGFARRAGGGIR